MAKRLREPANGLTHLAGAALALIGLGVLLRIGINTGNPVAIVALALFGVSQLGLYTASTLHHSLRLSEAGDRRLLKFDLCMVYVLIAGTYTPVCLIALHAGWRWGVLGTVWVLAICGVLMAITGVQLPLWLSTAFYVLLGWVALAAAPPLFAVLPRGGFVWLLAGGIISTIGALIFFFEWPPLAPRVFGAHALWHCCVLAGSGCFFWTMVRYVAPLA